MLTSRDKIRHLTRNQRELFEEMREDPTLYLVSTTGGYCLMKQDKQVRVVTEKSVEKLLKFNLLGLVNSNSNKIRITEGA